MYNINEKFRAAMKSPVIIPKLRGTIDGTAFTEEDILQGSFRVCNQCVDVSQLALGGVFIGELSLTLLPSMATSRGGWVGREIYIEYGLDCGDEVVYIPCPSGYYYVSAATWTADGLELVAYDSMGKLDETYSEELSSGTAFDWLTFIAKKTGVTIGNTRAEVEAMPNGAEQLGLYTADEIATYRDLLMFLSAALGGFATCGRDGSILIKSFTSPVVDSIDETKRFAGGSFSDYVTRYTGLSIVDIEKKEVIYYGLPVDDALTIKLGSNPFLQFGTEATKKAMRMAILNNMQSFQYAPYNVTLLGCCAYDLGDVIEFTGGIAGGSVGCVMSYDFGFNDYSFAGYGDNPALISAQSKLDKEISGLINQQSAEVGSVTPLTNISKIELSESWQNIGHVTLSVAKKQTALFHAVVKLKINQSGVARFMYRLNNDIVDFIHEAYVMAETDTVTLFIPLAIEPNVYYSFDIYIQSDGFTGTIELYDFRGAVYGIGVQTNNWDGSITVEDKFSLAIGRGYAINFVESGLGVDMQTPEPVEANDAFILESGRDYEIEFTDTVTLLTQTGIFDLITEDGRALTTEGGDPYITNGGTE